MRNKWTLSVIATLLLSVAITLWLVRGAEGAQVGLIVLTLTGVGGACLTLTVLRPQQLGLSPPNVMLSLGIGGMLLGLWWDVAQTPVRMLAALCISIQIEHSKFCVSSEQSRRHSGLSNR